jgi:hypothetical protein
VTQARCESCHAPLRIVARRREGVSGRSSYEREKRGRTRKGNEDDEEGRERGSVGFEEEELGDGGCEGSEGLLAVFRGRKAEPRGRGGAKGDSRTSKDAEDGSKEKYSESEGW